MKSVMKRLQTLWMVPAMSGLTSEMRPSRRAKRASRSRSSPADFCEKVVNTISSGFALPLAMI